MGTTYTDQQKQAAVRRYVEDGEHGPQIAADLGCAPATVLRWVRDAGHTTRRRGSPRYDQATKDHAVARYLDGVSSTQLADDVGCTVKTILDWVKAAGHDPRPHGGAEYTDQDKQQAVDRYLNGEPTVRIADDLGCTPTSVTTWVKAAGHQLHTTPTRNTFTDDERHQAVDRYLQGELTSHIAADIGCSNATILNWVRDAGHQTRPPSHDLYDDDDMQQAADLYATGLTTAQVAERIDVPATTIRDWLHRLDVDVRPAAGSSVRVPDHIRDTALDLHQQGVPTPVIGEACGVHYTTVSRWVRAAGLPPHRQRPTEEDRAAAVARLADGADPADVAAEFRVTRKTILTWARWHQQDTGEVVLAGLSGRTRTDEERAEAVEVYLSGTSAEAVAEMFDVGSTTVARWVHEAGHQMRPASHLLHPPETRAAAVAAYLDGEPTSAVAEQFGVSTTTIGCWVHDAGHDMRPGPGNDPYPQETRERVVDAYVFGEEGATWLSNTMEDAPTAPAIYRWVRTAGYQVRPPYGPSPYGRSVRRAAVQQYLDGATYSEVAADVGCAASTIHRWVHDAGYDTDRNKLRPPRTKQRATGSSVAPADTWPSLRS